MNNSNKEQLSALMDDEFDGLEKNQVEQILKDPEALETWSRYHLISDSLRGNLPEHLDRELAEKVSGAVAKEPAIVAPARLPRTLAKPVAGFAIAASVAALAILGVQQQQQGVHSGLLQDTLVQSTPGAGSVYAPVRQVSTGNANISSECRAEARENARREPANRQQTGANNAEQARSGRNCP